MSLFLYRIFLWLYVLGVRIAALKSPKARLWLAGRKNSRARIKEMGASLKKGSGPVIWMHCASLGEFEQGRPVLEALKQKDPTCRIVLSFFSPSGYEIRKNYQLAEHVIYLPMDGPGIAKLWLKEIEPALAIFVKYEFWYFYLTAVKKRNIPLLLVSGQFREDQPFFRWYGDLHRYMLDCFTHLFVQSQESADLLLKNGFKHVSVTGDTRFDRVIAIAEQNGNLPVIEHFCGHHPVLVAGSTWTEDEEELDHYAKIHPEIRFIIAPHEVDHDNISEVETLFPASIRYSELSRLLGIQPHQTAVVPEWTPPANGEVALKEKFEKANTLIIDNIGMLSRLYRYADVTYVGGGFGSNGLHNILEAAVYGKPVLFGPYHDKYPEAFGLVDAGGAIPIEHALDAEKKLDVLFGDVSAREKAGAAAKKFIYDSKGATALIMRYIEEKRLFTNW